MFLTQENTIKKLFPSATPGKQGLQTPIPFKARISNLLSLWLIQSKVCLTNFFNNIFTYKPAIEKNLNTITFIEIQIKWLELIFQDFKKNNINIKDIRDRLKECRLAINNLKKQNKWFCRHNTDYILHMFSWWSNQQKFFFSNLSASIITFRMPQFQNISNEQIINELKKSYETTKLLKEAHRTYNRHLAHPLDYPMDEPQKLINKLLNDYYNLNDRSGDITKMFYIMLKEKKKERIQNIKDVWKTFREMGLDNPTMFKHLKQFDDQTKETIIINIRFINYKLEWLLNENYRLVNQIRLNKEIDPNFVISIDDQHKIFDYFWNIDIQIKFFNLYKSNYPKLVENLPENAKIEKLIWKFERAKSNAWLQGYSHPDYLPEKAKMLNKCSKILWDSTSTFSAKIDALVTIVTNTKLWIHDKILCIILIIISILILLLLIIPLILILKKIIFNIFHRISKLFN